MKKTFLTYARWLSATPCAIILTISSCRTHQDERRVAGEGDGGEIGESSVFPPSLGWHSWISTEHSCVDEGGELEVTY